MLPLDGSIHDIAPDIVDAFAAIVPRRDWHGLTYADLTAGSCLLPLAFAAGGAGRVIVNDVAPRSTLAARALFGGAANAIPARPTPSFHFASDYLLKEVAATFDRLYFKRPPTALRQYLALLWVIGFATGEDDDFDILLTHDKARLRAKGGGWPAYLARAAKPDAVLRRLTADVEQARDLVSGVRAEVHQQDMLTLAPKLKWGPRKREGGPLFVAINPPTRGLDEYTIDDQLIHSLLANRWLPLSEWHEDATTFWTKRVRGPMATVPRGAYYLVYGGDGAMRWRDCHAVWSEGGAEVASGRHGKGGWAIFRRT